MKLIRIIEINAKVTKKYQIFRKLWDNYENQKNIRTP